MTAGEYLQLRDLGSELSKGEAEAGFQWTTAPNRDVRFSGVHGSKNKSTGQLQKYHQGDRISESASRFQGPRGRREEVIKHQEKETRPK